MSDLDLLLELFEPEFTPGCANRSGRPRGYANWRPHRKTEVLIDQVLRILVSYGDYLPLTVPLASPEVVEVQQSTRAFVGPRFRLIQLDAPDLFPPLLR